MSTDFLLPDIGEGIVECELVEWLVAEGDMIEEDQPVADVMTDKALVQIPAMHSGTVAKLYYQKGEIAQVHQPLFAINVEGESSTDEAPAVEPVADAVANSVVATPAGGGEEIDFILPDIGEGIVECEVVDWLVAEGETIEEDQPIADVMTDKALVQIPAISAGVITKLYYAKGDIAKVHEPLFKYQVAGTAAAVAPVKAVETPASTSAPTPVVSRQQDLPVGGGKAVASPAVRRLAREMDLDIRLVPGSGKNGRVYKDDLVKFQQAPVVAPVAATPAVTETVPSVKQTTVAADVRVEPLKGIKAAMAKQMVASVSTIPHFTYCEEIDMTDLVALRKQLKTRYQEQGIKLTMMPFFMKAMSLAIKEYPILNSQLNDDASEIHYFNNHNIGMAVDSKIGLLVPNVKDVSSKSILDVANEVTRLTDAARAGRLAQTDLSGGTITISNIGALGGTVATPIINKPEVAIVALGKLQTLPRFNAQGEVEARQIMQISWSGDHRVIDGGTIARFCNLWKSYLEDPSSMLVNMA